jgi:hypothetical protein
MRVTSRVLTPCGISLVTVLLSCSSAPSPQSTANGFGPASGGNTVDASLDGATGEDSASTGNGGSSSSGGSSSGEADAGKSACVAQCSEDSDCQSACPAAPSGSSNCCSAGNCYLYMGAACPSAPEAGTDE